MAMTITDITATPKTMREVASVGVVGDVGAQAGAVELGRTQLTISATMLAFQASPEAVIAPVT
ncbi:hypothetical protein [Mycolicibacterium aubagnense]|uniref:hypothetical protein n=1 Tax=Mycolicibacterium aubagnense TaxID=319707 RepID=UPI001F3DF109|nr:hypothetical protein [Mycolicibacterium aubagnense]